MGTKRFLGFGLPVLPEFCAERKTPLREFSNVGLRGIGAELSGLGRSADCAINGDADYGCA
jgi:hypothetical protein